ncbi:hypothetical protein C0Q70_01563 [Pomacea canaliculata]|uniref:Death domain-containing protein n=1 Tax=Pomacea canaliculata TaxID=400727 RepID=A0A2T7PZU6_POMCA|nr:hypothetical protein C0Q70_01563 [Pomacea canaliculata]
MGVYSSSFVINPQSSSAVSSYSHPSKANWITAHAIATELSIAEVERLWLRFQQLGCNQDGVLSPEVLNSPTLTSDVFVKNILKYFKTPDGRVTFETFLRGLKWSESQDVQVKARGIFQMLNNGNPIPKEMFGRILERVYPGTDKQKALRSRRIYVYVHLRAGQIEENDFVHTVLALPREPVLQILNFHILPEHMRENVHRNLPEFQVPHRGEFTPVYSPQQPEPRYQMLSEPMLHAIADKIHRRDWELLANKLGFLYADVDNYRQMYPDNTRQQVFQLLKDWKAREGPRARSDILEQALRDVGMTDVSLLLAP